MLDSVNFLISWKHRFFSAVVICVAMTLSGCNHLPGLPPVLPGPRGSVSAGVAYGVTYSPARVTLSNGRCGSVVLNKNADGRWGSDTLVTEVVDPRIAFAYVPIENVEVGLHAGFNSSGARVDAARLSNYVPLGLTLSAQTDNPVNRDSGAWVWEARGLVSLHPKVHKNWRLLIASGGSLGRRRHSFFSEELGKDAGADFTFASSSWDEELQITRSETRPEGAFDFSVSAFQQASLIFALQPYWVARAGTPNYRSVTGLGGEFSDFNMPWGAALTMTVLARVKP